MISSRESKAARSGQGGFTLIELAVALGVTAIVMLGILFLFDFNNKLTRVQSNVADMQQSLRIAQYDMAHMARMAGRGGLGPVQSVVITRDVDDEVHLIEDDEDSPKLLPGTDVLTLRGAFTTPIFQVSFTDPRSLQMTSATEGFVEVCKISPSGTLQDLASVESRLTQPEALILVSPLDDRFYIVVSLDPTKTSKSPVACPTAGPISGGLKLAFNTVSGYSGLSAPPADAALALQKVAYVGFLEEYRFYVREDHAVEGAPESELTPVLSRARFFPGTDNPYDSTEDIADGILDLQIAVGLDTDGDGRVVENLAAPNTDEWYGNAKGEPVINGGFKGLRISTLVRTRRADNTYEAPVLLNVEDHVYASDTADRVNSVNARKYRRRVLQTIVNLRNITT